MEGAESQKGGPSSTPPSHRRTDHHRPNGQSDDTNVNVALVRGGSCWWYRKYAPGIIVLEGLEKDAREAKKGLWTDPHPVPPWEWRKTSH